MNRGLKYIQTETTRHGKKIYYFRRKPHPRVRLNGEPFGECFLNEYNALFEGGYEECENRIKQQIGSIVPKLLKKLSNATARDKKNGRVSDITKEWAQQTIIKQKFRCALTGIQFSLGHGNGRISPFTPSLDRIDNSKGYTKDNVRIVCSAINFMMMDWEKGVFEKVVRGYLENNSIPAPTPAPVQSLKSKEIEIEIQHLN